MAHSHASGRPTASIATSLPRLLARECAHRFHRIRHLGDLHHFMRAHVLGRRNLRLALHHGNHFAADGVRHLHKHQSDRPAANHRNGVADFNLGLMQSTQHAGQRLNHGRFFVADVLGNRQHVQLNDALGNANVFRISAVVEEQVFAKIFLVFGTVEAGLAGRGIQRHHPHAFFECPNARADFFDHTRQLVPEQRRRHDHARMISPLVDLEIGAAGQGHLHLDQHFPVPHPRDGYFLNLYVLFTVEDSGRHLSVHVLTSFPRAARLNHDFHRIGLRMGSQV